MSAEDQRDFLLATADFWRCPNTGWILLGLQHDDKVLCGCGQPNPKAPRSESGPMFGKGYVPFIGCHVKKFLQTATVDEYLASREQEV